MRIDRSRLVGALLVAGVLTLAASTQHASAAGTPGALPTPSTFGSSADPTRPAVAPAALLRQPDTLPTPGRRISTAEPTATTAPASVTSSPSPTATVTPPGRGDDLPTRRPAKKPVTVVRQPGQIMRTTGAEGVALTFDDGPDPRFTPRLLAMLRETGVKATFCVIGVNVRSHPELVQAIVRDGHSMCNHTWDHDLSLGRRSPQAIREDLQRTNDEIRKAAPGVPVSYFRHPGGNFTPAAVQVAAELGMSSLGWTVDPSDWNTGSYGGGMSRHIVGSVQSHTHPGGVVLSHDGGGERSATISAYESLLPWLAARFTLIALPA